MAQRKGQRREPAANRVRSSFDLNGWLPFAEPFGFPFRVELPDSGVPTTVGGNAQVRNQSATVALEAQTARIVPATPVSIQSSTQHRIPDRASALLLEPAPIPRQVVISRHTCRRLNLPAQDPARARQAHSPDPPTGGMLRSQVPQIQAKYCRGGNSSAARKTTAPCARRPAGA